MKTVLFSPFFILFHIFSCILFPYIEPELYNIFPRNKPNVLNRTELLDDPILFHDPFHDPVFGH